MLMARTSGAWTLADLERLPDDGNKYELVDGELFVTPAPSPAHEHLVAVLHDLLSPYVRAQRIGRVFTTPAVVRAQGSEVEPDLMVRPITSPPDTWDLAPIPLLVVEILSRTTWRRDHEAKRLYYLRNGVAEYWIVDGVERTIQVAKPNADDVVIDSQLEWLPTGVREPLVINVVEYFREALD